MHPFKTLVRIAAVCYLIAITSCNGNAKKDILTGKWSFDKFEMPANLPPGSVPEIDDYNKANRGMVMTFMQDGKFTTEQKGGADFNNRSGQYKLLEDDKILIGEDTIKIVQLERNVMRLYKDDESPVVVFRRK